MLAAGSLRSNFVRNASGNLVGNVQPIVMLDRDPAALPGVLNPGLLSDSDFNILRGAGIDGLPYHTSGGLHANDRAPVRIVALAGDISGENYFNNLGLGVVDTLNLAKRAEIIAGGDIKDLGFKIQNMNAGDVTKLKAGRDLIDSTSPANPSVVRHVVTGPGVIDASAGRNVDLGNGVGIATRGNILNPYLPEGGAAIVVSAGARADYAGFAQQRLAPTDLPLAEQEALKAYVSGLNPALPANPDLATAWAEFGKLDGARRSAFLEARKPVLDQIYFAQLRTAVGAVGGGALDLAKFDAVIASLYPSSAVSGGDINVFGSQFRTEQGGAIDLFAPGGSIFAGLVNVPATLRSKSAAELGIFTIRGGPISAQVKSDFLVNQGRVFSLGGGDITLASASTKSSPPARPPGAAGTS